MNEIFYTKTTKLGTGLYGCRVYLVETNKLVVELRVPRRLISTAYRDMFRTLDKLGYNSQMAHASRMRGKNHESLMGYRYVWG